MEKKKKSKIIYIALLLCLLGVTAGLTYAWFRQSYSLSTVAKIKANIQLDLTAGNGEDVSRFQIGTIDTRDDEVKQKDYVIAVKGEKPTNYVLQIGHTTNIPFTYTLYKATESDGGAVIYVGSDNKAYKYSKGEKIAGKYLNKVDGKILANSDGTYHEKTYNKDNTKSYDQVQENAEPLYWKSTEELGNKASGFVDYYILTVSWEKRGSEQNKSDGDRYKYIDDIDDKETDIVYISVSATGEEVSN